MDEGIEEKGGGIERGRDKGKGGRKVDTWEEGWMDREEGWIKKKM